MASIASCASESMCEAYSAYVQAEDESPLEREELTLPDGRRLLLYSRADDGGE